MIEEQVRIHDKYSLEIKMGFIASEKLQDNRFKMNIWMFIPNSLDINRFTYNKNDFYRDMRSNIRLITPVYTLKSILNNENSPFSYLKKAFNQLIAQPNRTAKLDYEYQIKMFLSILKSSLRDEISDICSKENAESRMHQVNEYVKHVPAICKEYRQLRQILDSPSIPTGLLEYYAFGDEFMSNLVEFYTFTLMDRLQKKHITTYENVRLALYNMLTKELAYKKSQGYLLIEEDSKQANHDFVFRLGMLKKYAESHLFLSIRKRKDGILAEQLLFSIAAGISMIFATFIAFTMQQKYGSYTMPLFVGLVVSYMLKDRIKEFARFYFAHKMGSRYFDHKIDMSINGTKIGWVKEGIDFVSESKIPAEVLKTRNRSSILEANNRASRERILLYRTQMRIDRSRLEENSQYLFDGVNSIIRLNVSQLIQKMDNAVFPLYYPNETDGFKMVKGEKIYYLNLVIQLQHEAQLEYHRYRVVFNRKGIKKLESF